MDKTQFSSSMEAMLRELHTFLSSKTVVGEPIYLDDATLVPLVDVSFGAASGSAASGKSDRDRIAGGLNGKISPIAILVIQNGTTKLVNIKTTDNITKLLDMVPDLMNKITTNKARKVTVSDDAVRDAVKDAADAVSDAADAVSDAVSDTAADDADQVIIDGADAASES